MSAEEQAGQVVAAGAEDMQSEPRTVGMAAEGRRADVPQAADAVSTDEAARSAKPGRYYLRALHVDAFGAMYQKDVGPFGPGLNVVFGRNESGKTTVRQFVGGVLFGWKRASAKRNGYNPASGDRSGSLQFMPRAGVDGKGADDAAGAVRVERTRGTAEDDKDAPGSSGLLDDVDEATYDNVFSLDTDELMDLKSGNDLTSRFLSASADTEVPPAKASEQIDHAIHDVLTRSAKEENQGSIPNLQARLQEVGQQVAEEEDKALSLFDDREELKSLEERQKRLRERRDGLSGAKARLDDGQRRLASLRTRFDQVDKEAREADEQGRQVAEEARACEQEAEGLPKVAAGAEDRLREQVAERKSRRGGLEQSVVRAQGDLIRSTSDYKTAKQALERAQEASTATKAGARVRRVLPAALSVALVAIGAVTFSIGRVQASLSISGLGLAIVAVGLVVLAATLKGNHDEAGAPDPFAARKDAVEKAEWTRDKDQSTLEASRQALADEDEKDAAWLSQVGLSAAEGSLGEADRLLEKVARLRERQARVEQRRQAADGQRAQAQAERRRLQDDFDALSKELGEGDVRLEPQDLAARLASQSQEAADGLSQVNKEVEDGSARLGELSERLSNARNDVQMDELRMEQARLATALDDAYRRYAVLLTAKDLMDGAMAKWEAQSRPDVYQEAGRLLSMMTDGAWSQVGLDESGQVQAASLTGVLMSPVNMSLGTRQQLYLALRIALLSTAEDVGRNVPVLCDDVLVNFDEKRRQGAVRALADLAKKRQVIVFTCHRDVKALVQKLADDVSVVEL